MMSYRVVVPALMLAFCLSFGSAQPFNCPTNQEEGCRPCWGGTCESLASSISLKCNGPCNPGCVCKKDYYLQNNECVHVSQCVVPCPENMVFSTCAKASKTCQNLSDASSTTEECKPRCVCKDGYVFSGKKPRHCIIQSECEAQPTSN